MAQSSTDSPVRCINPDCGRSQRLAVHRCPNCGTTLRLGDRYIPLQLLSSGRFTTTYIVHDLKTQQEAVLKVMIEATPETVRCFRQDAKVLASLRHPGLPKVEVGSYFQVSIKMPKVRLLPCFVMEKVTGKTLKTVIEENPNGCPEAWVLDWLMQAAKALQVVQGRQVVHGNLKPENLLLQESGQLVVVGFGSARRVNPVQCNLARRPEQAPLQGYMPPEQTTQSGLNPTIDGYALGCVGIQLLTGLHPAHLEDPQTGQWHWRDKIRVSKPLADLLDQMVHPAVQSRPKSMADVHIALTKIPTKQGWFQAKRWVDRQQRRRSHSRPKPNFAALLAPIQTVESTVEVGMERFLDVGQGFSHSLRTMIQVGLGGAIGAGVGCWLIYSSPIAASIWQFFASLPPKFWHISVLLQPAILIFMLAGLGSVWAGINVPDDERPHHVGSASVLGSLGYALAWISWQWVAQENATQAFARLAAIAALALALELSSQRPLWLHAIVAMLGTSITVSALIHAGLVNIDALFALFPDATGVQLQLTTSTHIMSVVFFGLLGAIACFWIGVSQRLVQVLTALFQSHS